MHCETSTYIINNNKQNITINNKKQQHQTRRQHQSTITNNHRLSNWQPTKTDSSCHCKRRSYETFGGIKGSTILCETFVTSTLCNTVQETQVIVKLVCSNVFATYDYRRTILRGSSICARTFVSSNLPKDAKRQQQQLQTARRNRFIASIEDKQQYKRNKTKERY
jgi:hypothetical protein